ncbi:MAG: hypothetical protein U1F81_13565 [Verrucomicrobiaceae bacterium]
MQALFTLTGIALGALFGFKSGFGVWLVAGFIGLLIEFIVGISIINVAPSSGHPWAAGIGGFILGNATGSLAKFFFKH